MLAVAVATGVCCGGGHAALLRLAPGGGGVGEIARLGAAVTLGFATTVGGALALRVPEAKAVVSAVSRLARRSRRA
jgi:hypothetical protein